MMSAGNTSIGTARRTPMIAARQRGRRCDSGDGATSTFVACPRARQEKRPTRAAEAPPVDVAPPSGYAEDSPLVRPNNQKPITAATVPITPYNARSCGHGVAQPVAGKL